MKLINRKVRNEKLYSVGYDEKSKQYIMEIVITWIAWYNRYYLISKEEYQWFETFIEKLDTLADRCLRIEEFGDRFIKSDKLEENR